MQQLAVHTAGGVVTEAQVLLVLVPDDAEVTAEVVLENKDVGFVRVGQAAEIKLETFPFTRYGTVAAEVKSISADAVNDEKRGAIFPATLVLKQSTLAIDGKTIPPGPGHESDGRDQDRQAPRDRLPAQPRAKARGREASKSADARSLTLPRHEPDNHSSELPRQVQAHGCRLGHAAGLGGGRASGATRRRGCCPMCRRCGG